VRDDRQRLVDILDAIDRVYRHTGSGREAFERDELVQVWVLRHLQLIGEAARHLSQEIRTQYPEIPWAAIVVMRNFLVHDYFVGRLRKSFDGSECERYIQTCSGSASLVIARGSTASA